jgi:hypothetical protein
MWEGEWAWAMMSCTLVNGSSQTAAPFQFPFIVLLHGRGALFNFNPRRLLQLQSHRQLHPSSPSTSIFVANFIPRR